MISTPHIIGIDGMQHTGKGELINVLLAYFKEQGYKVLVMKGAGSRSGKGSTNTLYDPEDAWRQATTPTLYSESLSESRGLWEQANAKLQRELRELLNQLELPDIILLDRTIFTSNAFRRITNPNETMTETARYYKETYDVNIYLPHTCVVFFADNQQILENRIDPKSPGAALKLESLLYNSLFNASIFDAKTNKSLHERMLLINTDNSLENIHTLVLQALSEKNGPIGLPLQNKQKKL